MIRLQSLRCVASRSIDTRLWPVPKRKRQRRDLPSAAPYSHEFRCPSLPANGRPRVRRRTQLLGGPDPRRARHLSEPSTASRQQA
eukprot:scaffold205876_cov21-Tisochrysis_lutea.AAC.2